MQGIILNSPSPLVGTLIAPTDYSDSSSPHVYSRRRWANGYMTFSMQFEAQHKAEAELLRHFVKQIRGDTEIWFDGGEFNDLIDFQHVGIGDGSTTQFQLPNFNVFGSSLIVKVNDVVEPNWTCYDAPGVIEFTTAPPDKSDIKAKYKCRSKCKLLYEEASALKQTDNFKFFVTDSVIFREVP